MRIDIFNKAERGLHLRRAVSALTAAVMLGACALTAFAEGSGYVCEHEAHAHQDTCYASQLACGQAEGAEGEAAGHQHTEACYAQVLVCAIEEHTHSDACLPAPVALEAPVDEAPVDEAVEDNAPAEEAEPGDTAADAAQDADAAAQDAEVAAEGAGQEAPAEDAGTEAEATEGETVDIQDEETPLESRTVQLYEDDEVRITVTYDDETLPAGAEMVATPITAESDPEAFAYLLEQAGAGENTPAVFYSIRFVADGQEVEPTSPVEVKFQFLQEDGFQVSEDTTVLHLDENGAEALETEVTVEDNTATFHA